MNEERIRELEEELKRTKYNKATQHHIALLKARIARLKESGGKKKGGSKEEFVKKTGDATVVMIGYPSVGKSTLLTKLTNAESKIADYEFTTLTAISGIMEYNGARIQIIDVPGIIDGAHIGRGRGREVLAYARIADLIVIMADRPEQIASIKRELYNAGFRLNKEKPDIKIEKRHSGGLSITIPERLRNKITKDMVRDMLAEFKIYNGEVVIKGNVSIDDFVDVLASNRVYVPCIRVLNKIDISGNINHSDVDLAISAKEEINLDKLKGLIWEKLNLMRVYMKKIGKEADMKEPLIMKSNSSVYDVAKRIHKDIAKNLVYARVWGKSAKFEGQRVGIRHVLMDGDIVELHYK